MRAPTAQLVALQLALASILCVGALEPSCALAAGGWIPPRSVTALLPSATFAPGSTHAIELTVRANGVPGNLDWTATAAGGFALAVSPLSGSVAVPPDSTRRVPLTVTVPGGAQGVASLTVEITDQIGGGHLTKAVAAIYSASGGQPEVWPAPSAWAAPAGTAGAVSFQIHSLLGTSELVVLTSGRSNPDPNNAGALFTGTAPAAEVNLPGGGTITVSAPTTIAGSAYGGNANSVQLSVTNSFGISNAVGHALASSSLPDSLPVALYPVGLVPLSEAAAGRDGLTELPGRNLWLLPAGLGGVRVMEAGTTLARIGAIDLDGGGNDDRLVGQVRIPSFAASVAVVPGFIGPVGDTLDLGLLAAGNAGLMLLDLRTVADPPFGTWEDFFDLDANGIDDRILRRIPIPGFATDVAWFRAPTGRVVALVAGADVGSNPVASYYDPDSVAAGTGAGIVAIDVTAAFDSSGGIPYAAGTLPTAGSALDLELRGAGSGSPDLAVADGTAGVSVYHLTTATGPPATVAFTLLGSVSLSSTWGSPYARDATWVSNTRDSVYLAVAAMAGGVQLIRAPIGGTPSLVLAQQTSAPAVGLAGTWTGTLAAALGSGGVALFRVPGAAELDRIAPAAPPPYTAPVALPRGQTWTEGRPLELAWHQTPSSSATSLRFLPVTGGPVPDVLVSDGPRVLLLRPGQATIVAVEGTPTPPRAAPLAVSVFPNPVGETAQIRVSDAAARLGGPETSVEIFDVQGRLVRGIDLGARAREPASVLRLKWDGRDYRGRRLGSGRYWVRVRVGGVEGVRDLVLLR